MLDNEVLLEHPVVYDAYVDGSFSAKLDRGSWAYTIVEPTQDTSIAEATGLLDYTLTPELRKLRNIATECSAVIHALEYASQYGIKLNIFYDYIGLEKWVSDITTGEEPWMCNSDFTWDYRQTVLAYMKYLNKIYMNIYHCTIFKIIMILMIHFIRIIIR